MSQSNIFRWLFDNFIRCSEEEFEAFDNEMDFYADELIQSKEAIVAFANPYANEQQMANIKLLVDEIDYLVGATLLLREDSSANDYNKYDEVRSENAKQTLLKYVDSLIDNAPDTDEIWDDYKAKYPVEYGNMRRHLQ